MTAPKGYAGGSKLARTNAQFATVEQIRLDQFGLSVLAHQFVYSVGTDAVDSASTSVITAAAHAAQKGDVIRFTSGALLGREVKVDSTATNTITLAEDLSSAPAAAVTFEILRHKYPVVTSSGGLTAAFSYTLDGASQAVLKDTVTPANNKPLPVELIDSSGNVNRVSATQSGTWNINNISGTVSLPTGASVEAKQDVGNTSLAAIDTKLGTLNSQTDGLEGSLSSIDTKVSTAAKQDTGNTSLSSIDSKLTTLNSQTDGLEASLSSIDGKMTACNTGAVVVSSSVLPTGAASEATLSAQSAKLPATLGQKAMAASMSVALSSDQSAIPVSQSGTWTVQPGNTANTTAWLTRQAGKAFANAPVRNDYSSVNVTTAAYVQLVASTTALTTEIEIFDSSGQTLALAVGAAASEVNQIYIIPGGNGRIPLAIPASSRVSVKAISATASAGELVVNFYG